MKNVTLIILMLLTCSLVYSQNVGIGTDFPNANSILDVKADDKGILIPRMNTSTRDANITPSLGAADEGLLIYNTLQVKFNYWDGTKWVPFPEDALINADNGLYVINDEVRMGGDLIEQTNIEFNSFTMDYKLNGTGDFSITDGGSNTHFIVRDDGKVGIGANTIEDTSTLSVTGISYFSDDIFLRDGAVNSGFILGKWYDESSDGVFELNRNNNMSIRLHADGHTIFNEQERAIDFTVRSDNNEYAFHVDGTNDLVRIGDNNSGETQFNGQNSFGNVTLPGGLIPTKLEYVADFQVEGTAVGSAVGIGTREFIFDFGSDILATNASLFPVYNLTQDIGAPDSSLSWDDIFCDELITISDERQKAQIKKSPYGLDELMQIETYSYVLKNDPFKERKLGIMAQEVEPIIEEAIKTHNYRLADENGLQYEKYAMPIWGVNYSTFIPVLINGIKEQQAIIDAKTNEIELLQNQYDDLLNRVQQLELHLDKK